MCVWVCVGVCVCVMICVPRGAVRGAQVRACVPHLVCAQPHVLVLDIAILGHGFGGDEVGTDCNPRDEVGEQVEGRVEKGGLGGG
jgi:hypothetical protein